MDAVRALRATRKMAWLRARSARVAWLRHWHAVAETIASDQPVPGDGDWYDEEHAEALRRTARAVADELRGRIVDETP